jgi:hypothetical protein
MSFWRHEEIYRSDGGLGEARNRNGCRRSPHSSAAMSFQSAIPRQVALQQCLPLLHRLGTILNNQCCRTMILQRTATTPLTSCLSPRVHSTAQVLINVELNDSVVHREAKKVPCWTARPSFNLKGVYWYSRSRSRFREIGHRHTGLTSVLD